MQDIFSYIKIEEARYNTVPVPVVENYEWHMARHVKLTTLYLNSQFETGNAEFKPFKNIVLPAVNLQHRAVEFAVKDIDFFIDDRDSYYKAFLVKKFHEKWARENDLSNYLDELTETYTDYGGVLTKKLKSAVPIVIPFQQLAFCDQTDISTGPICEKHQYSPDVFKEMEASHWGDSAYGATATLDEVITLAQKQKTTTQVKGGRIIETPNKYIEVYELHGVFPLAWLENPEGKDIKETDYTRQMHIVCFYQKENGEKEGITLYKGKERESIYKVFKRDPIYGRALGRGAVEELFESQVWINYSEIQQKEMLDVATKVIFQIADKTFATKNNLSNVEQGQIFGVEEGKAISQINTSPINMVAFENSLKSWADSAKEISASYDTISGAESKSGMPFRLGALLNQEAHSLHKYRKGKIGGIFLPQLYRDWILPEIRKELSNDQVFSSMLSLEEMNMVAESVITHSVNEHIKQKVLSGLLIDPGEIPALQQTFKEMFFKKGNQKFFKLFKDEIKDLPLDISVNVTNEEKDRAAIVEKLSGVFAQIMPVLGQNPQFFDQNPMMAKLFMDVIENSGLDPLGYATKGSAPAPRPAVAPTAVPTKTAPTPAPATA